MLRFYYIYVYRKVGEKAYYYHSEVVQRWIARNGKYATLAKLRPMSCFHDTWQFSSNLEIRPERELYDILPTAIYPKQGLIPELKRSGFKGDFHKLTPFELFQTILTKNKAETLLKTGQTALLRHFIRSKIRNIDFYWSSIRIAIRNEYIIKDGSIWCDYIDLLYYFDKDIHNSKYVCSKNLKAEHDQYVQKKSERQKQERFALQQKKMQEEETVFQEMKGKFFGLSFTNGTIYVKVLESLREFFEEGESLHHCVYTSEYYLKPKSLILFSARLAEKRIKTIEVSLETLNVVQSRGLQNSNTEYHEQILSLERKNIRFIRQRLQVA